MNLLTNTAILGTAPGHDPAAVAFFSATGVLNGTIELPHNVAGAGALAVSVVDDRIYAQSQGEFPIECLIGFYDSAGTLKATVIPENVAFCLYVPEPGKVWIANSPVTGPGTIDEYDVDGNHLRLVVTLTCSDGGGDIWVGQGMAVRGGFLYFVAIRGGSGTFGGIFRADLATGICTRIVAYDNDQHTYAPSFALTPGGTLLLHGGGTEPDSGVDTVWRYSLTGDLLNLYTNPVTPIAYTGLVADPDDLHFYVGSYAGISRVLMSDGSWTGFDCYVDPYGFMAWALALPVLIVPRPREAIRFVRVFPHLSDEQFQVFCSRLEFECQRGVGTIAGQGENPQALLSVSRDGGMTFGPERMLTMGKIGEYLTRCYTTRLGRSRDFVFRLVVTDPVLVAFMACLVDLDGGTS